MGEALGDGRLAWEEGLVNAVGMGRFKDDGDGLFSWAGEGRFNEGGERPNIRLAVAPRWAKTGPPTGGNETHYGSNSKPK